MNKHTAGPWEYSRRRSEVGVKDNPVGTRPIAIFPAEYGREEYAEINIANAHLIAAAPELLEALEATMHIIAAINPGCAAVHNALTVIAKARGNS